MTETASRISRWPEWTELTLQALLASTAVVLFGMVAAYFQNLHEHSYSIFQLMPWVLLLWLLAAFGFFALAWLSARVVSGARHWFIPVVVVLLWAQAAFNVPAYGPLDGSAIAWPVFQHLRDVLLVLLVLGAFWWFRNQLRGQALTVVAVLAGVQLVYATSAVVLRDQPMPRAEVAEDEAFRLSEQSNDFLIVLDAFQSDVFAEVLARRPDYAERLQGFVYYPDTVGVHPTTVATLPALLLGEPYTNHQPLALFRHRIYSEDSLLADYRDAGYQVDLMVRSGLPRGEASRRYVDHAPHVSQAGVARGPRLEEAAGLFEFTAFRSSPQALRQLMYYRGVWTLSRLVFAGQVASYPHRLDLLLRDALQRRSYVGGEQPVFRFIHFYTPHMPLVFDADLRPAGIRPLNRENYVDQAEAGLKLLLSLVDLLQDHGVYDNSRIVVVADHGLPGMSVRGGLPGRPGEEVAQDMDEDLEYVIAGGLPLLLVRERGALGPLEISQLPAELLDVVRSLADGLGEQNRFSGYSLFTETPPAERRREHYFYDWGRHGFHSRYLDPVQVYTVEGHAWLADSWSGPQASYRPDAAEGGEFDDISRPDYVPGTTIDLRAGGNASPWLGSGWSHGEPGYRWTSGETAEIVLSGDFDPDRDYRMTLTVRPFLVEGKLQTQRLKVEVNGRHLGTVELQDWRPQQVNIEVPAEAVRPEGLEIRFHTPDHAVPAELGLGVDRRRLAVSVTHLVVE